MPITVSENIKRIPDFYVLKIDKIANDLIEGGKDIIKLNLGKSEIEDHRTVKEVIKGKIFDPVASNIIDPQGLPQLRKKIVSHYKKLYGVDFSYNQVFVNNGTSPLLLSIFSALVDKGESVLLPRPYYPSYNATAEMVYAKKDFYNIVDGKIDIEDFRKNFDANKTKLVVMNSPGNPLGNVLDREEFKQVLEIINGNAFVLSDEIYDGYVYDNFTSILDVFDRNRDKVILVNGFSKMHHMYTRRLGYAIVPEETVPNLLKFQQHNIVCVDPVTQYAGIASLENIDENLKTEIKKEVDTYKKRLEDCRKLISKTKLKTIEPKGSWYLCVDISNYLDDDTKSSLDLAELLIKKADVAVAPGIDFGDDNIFRISLTGSRSVEGMERMCNFLKTLS